MRYTTIILIILTLQSPILADEAGYQALSENMVGNSSFEANTDGWELLEHTQRVKAKYIDYETDNIQRSNNNAIDLLSTYMHKRKCFEHENELRAIATKPDYASLNMDILIFEKGVSIPINLNTLIEAIYISPESETWIRDLVESVCYKYELKVPVHKSKLLDSPLF